MERRGSAAVLEGSQEYGALCSLSASDCWGSRPSGVVWRPLEGRRSRARSRGNRSEPYGSRRSADPQGDQDAGPAPQCCASAAPPARVEEAVAEGQSEPFGLRVHCGTGRRHSPHDFFRPRLAAASKESKRAGDYTLRVAPFSGESHGRNGCSATSCKSRARSL